MLGIEAAVSVLLDLIVKGYIRPPHLIESLPVRNIEPRDAQSAQFVRLQRHVDLPGLIGALDSHVLLQELL